MAINIVPVGRNCCTFANIEKGYTYGPIVYGSKYYASSDIAQEFQEWMKERAIPDMTLVDKEQLMIFYKNFLQQEHIIYDRPLEIWY